MRQYIHFSQPLFGNEEKKAVQEVLDSGWVTLGPKTKEFESQFAQYVGAKYAIALTSCTAALHLSFLVSGIQKGDEVITTPFTFAATSNTIIHAGAKPVFVDIRKDTFNIDPDQIENKITKKTKAIVPVHYGGAPADMDKIMSIAERYNLKVIEDAAHALGAEYKGRRIGSIGDLTCFSFHPIKNISTGDGGMITTNNAKYAERLAILRLHGMSKDAWKRYSASGSWKYDIELPGYKYNMTDVQSALGVHQLKKLDIFIKTREKYTKIYNEAFSTISEITTPFVVPNSRHAYNLYTIMIDTNNLKVNRDDIVEKLKQEYIGASVYFIPLHLFTYYKKQFGYRRGDFPVSEQVFKGIVSLPLYPKMKVSDIYYVIKKVKDIILSSRL